MKVLLRAPLLTNSGYGVHSRQIFEWLEQKKDIDLRVDCLRWGHCPWIVSPDGLNGLAGRIMSRAAPFQKHESVDVSFQVQLPNEWDPKLAKKNIGFSAFVETDRCNPTWLNACNSMDAVVVPSEHVKTCISNTGHIDVPLFVIPESYYECLSKESHALDVNFSTKFNFLLFGQLTGTNPASDRKNLFYTIKWLCETFKDNKDVGIVLKTNSGRNTKIDKVVTKQVFEKLLKEVRPSGYPKVHLLHGNMSQQEIGALYRHNDIKALVSFTRGEGYGLPLLEASVSGLPVIATNWSGHLDFLGKGKFLPVSYDLKEVHSSRIDNNIFIPGSRWAEPREHDAKSRLRKFYKSPELPNKWAKDLQQKLTEQFSQSHINHLYDESLGVFFK